MKFDKVFAIHLINGARIAIGLGNTKVQGEPQVIDNIYFNKEECIIIEKYSFPNKHVIAVPRKNIAYIEGECKAFP